MQTTRLYFWPTVPNMLTTVLWKYIQTLLMIIIMEAFIKRRIPGKTTCSKALQYNSYKVVIKLKLY